MESNSLSNMMQLLNKAIDSVAFLGIIQDFNPTFFIGPEEELVQSR